MNKYRITKYQERFYIEVLKSETKTTGMLWWKKKEIIRSYVRCDDMGMPLLILRFIPLFQTPLLPFACLKDAQDKIDMFLSPTEVIEYPNPPLPRDTTECSYPR